ncbi:MAG TPA: Rieske 2Fe-2S domain-containing protein [Candidatus Deferrimicrobium sp.]|nr:Rieske 2Fe-2S domain-containing protein [Candidatus Deferrimicrobium sp.]
MRIKMGSLVHLSPGHWLDKQVLARRVAVYNDGGRFYGIEADCKHMKASLATGQVEHGIVTCRWHGWRYDLKTGLCLNNTRFRLKTYRVDVVGQDVYVEI